MPDFAIRNLSVLSYAQGFTAWHYKARMPLADALAPGFLRPAASMLEPGDTVMISAQDGGALIFVHDAHPDLGVVVGVMSRTKPA